MPNTPTRKVLIYLDRYLPPSQAFIPKQARALQRYQPSFLVGQKDERAMHETDISLKEIRQSIPLRASEIILKVFRVPVPPLVQEISPFELIHAHFGKNGYVIHPVTLRAARPLVTTFHGFDATFQGSPNSPGGFNSVRFFSQGRKAMAGWNTWQIAVSDFIKDKLLELGFDEKRVFRHYIGIDTSLFRPQDNIRRRGRVVSIARFVEVKGHSYMIEALRLANEAGADIDFVMVGQGPLRSKIEALARKHLPKVTVHDNLTQPEIRELLSEAQIYLHGSVTLSNGVAEAMGIANLEAAALGTPVVAFRSGGVGEGVEDGASGYLISERDVNGMASAVFRLLQDNVLWSAFSRRAAHMVVERFDIKRQSAILEAYYDEVIERYNKGARK